MKRTYIIAEIAQGFEGDVNLVKRFIKVAQRCGADAIKFQIFKSDEICITDYQYYNFFKSLEIDERIWTEIINESATTGIDIWTDIYGVETLEWISKTKIKGFKIHSTDVRSHHILSGLKDKKYNILLSTGGSTLDEVEKAIKMLGDNTITLMSGFQAEPNMYSDVELDKINFLTNKFRLPVGYADHIDANDELAVTLPSLAVMRGASVIEKHLTIDRNNLQLEDYVSALNPEEFKKMIEMIRKVEQFNDAAGYSLSEREEIYRHKTKKIILAANDIKEGKVIAPSDLTMLRTGQKFSEIIDIDQIVGKVALNAIRKHAVIERTMLS